MTVALNTGANIDTETTPAPEGHEAAMVAKFEASQKTAPEATAPAAPETTERPAWLPEKFKTAEEFAKSYSELEKKLGGSQTTEKPAATTTEIPATTDAAREQVENAGLDFDAISDEFTTAGALSEATYEKLAKAGINKTVADQYIAGQQALANQTRTEVFNVAGGEEAYVEMVTWAKTALTPEAINAYNNAMNSRDINSMKLAVDGLKARFAAENGTTPSLVGGSTSGASKAGDAFRSTAELTTAMKDPRYATDPAYRADVAAKLGRSNIL